MRKITVVISVIIGLTGCKSEMKDSSFLAALLGGANNTNSSTQIAGEIPGYDPSNPSLVVEQKINAANGGTIYFNDEAVLTIPPGSLETDTTISVEKVTSLPSGEMDGYSNLTQAFKFKPEGLVFATEKPALLTVKYDKAELLKKGLSPQLTEMYYFDPGLGRYMLVPSGIDTNTNTITSKIEHFTIYLPAAKAINTSTNPAPIVNPLLTIPGPIRAGAPFYIRFKAYDQGVITNPISGDPPVLGSIASIKVYVCKLHTGSCFSDWMTAETTVDPNYGGTTSENMYGYTIPASFWSNPVTSDLGVGNDIQIYAEAWDNLGKMSTSSVVNVDVTRKYVPGSLIIENTSSPMIVSAGYSRILRLRGKDDANVLFPLIPRPQDVVVSGGVGSIGVQPSYSTIAFKAIKSGNGDITVNNVGPGYVDQKTELLKVMPGNLARLEIRAENGIQIPSNQIAVDGRSTYNFDVVGYDSFDNLIYVVPQNWIISNNAAGTIANGILDTTPNLPLLVNVTAKIGNITSDPISVNIIPRFRVKTDISGLNGALVLSNINDTLTANINGVSNFATMLYNSANYVVSIISQPFNQSCHLSGNITGTINLADVVTTVKCYSILGGAVVSGNLGISNIVSTIAGSSGALGNVDGLAGNARFRSVTALTNDGKYIYLVENVFNQIRRVDPVSGQTISLVGSGSAGSQDGIGLSASFNGPDAITNDGTYLYVGDSNNCTIRRINIQTKIVTTIVGLAGQCGAQEGTGINARIKNIRGITTDGNNLYATDNNHVIWKVDLTPGASYANTTILAGSIGYGDFLDGVGNLARFYFPSGVVTDGAKLFIADNGNNRIRVLDLVTKNVTTLAGSGSASFADSSNGLTASFNAPSDLVKAGQNLYITDVLNNRVRKLDLNTTEVITIAGNNNQGYNSDGPGNAVYLNSPNGITTDGINLFFSDSSNYLIRRIY